MTQRYSQAQVDGWAWKRSTVLPAGPQKRVIRLSTSARAVELAFRTFWNPTGSVSMTMKRELAMRSRQTPLVATIMGECFGGPSWLAALADFVVQVKGSCMAVSGPRVLEMATGEKIDNEDLGGWRLHAEITGQVDRVAEDEADCFRIVREFLSYLPSSGHELPPLVPPQWADQEGRQEKLLSIVPDESRRGYDMNSVIKCIVDDERIFPIKPDFERSVITCLARIDGCTVGIIANQPIHTAGAMGPDGCDKCCSFICLCDSFNIPLIFLHDTPGFLVSKAAELKRMPGKIINFIEAVSLSTVPKVSIVIRKSYGMAYSNMCGTGMGADFVFAWPNAEISFMAPEVAANVVFRPKIDGSGDPQAAREQAERQMRVAGAPWKAAGLHLLEDVIDRRDTRKVISRILTLAAGNDGGHRSRRLRPIGPPLSDPIHDQETRQMSPLSAPLKTGNSRRPWNALESSGHTGRLGAATKYRNGLVMPQNTSGDPDGSTHREATSAVQGRTPAGSMPQPVSRTNLLVRTRNSILVVQTSP